MLRCSRRISNRKILKTEEGEGVASTIASNSETTETRALDGKSSSLTLEEGSPLQNEVKPTVLRRSSKISNLKKLKTEGGEHDDQTHAAPDDGDGNFSGSAVVALNPMQNAVVLRHLFEVCPVEMLATCRLVCKQWNEESLLSWRNSSPLRFTLENRKISLKSIWNDEARHAVPLQNFLEYTADPKHQCHNKPYRYIRLRDSTIGLDRGSKKQFKIFWNALGGNLTTLEFRDCKFPDGEEFRRIIFTCCPKLKRLIINECKFSETRNFSVEELDPLDNQEHLFEQNKHLQVLKIVGYKKNERKLPVSWVELFSHYPRMSSLSIISTDYKMRVAEFDKLTNAIRVIRKRDGNLLPFKYFDIGDIRISAGPLTQQKLIIFRELRLPVQSILVNLESEVDREFFKDNFMLTCHQLDDVLKVTFEGSFQRFCKHMACLKFLPNLEELQICGNGPPPPDMAFSNTRSSEATHLTMMKVTQLTLRCWLQDDEIAKLYDWMPNVTNLSVRVKNNKQFGIVCKQWKNLKVLGVYRHRLTDDGVMGMKNETGANITNLQNLEMFFFSGNKLTTKSVFHGFLKLPNLRYLIQSGNKPLVQWGKMARRALENRNITLIEDRT